MPEARIAQANVNTRNNRINLRLLIRILLCRNFPDRQQLALSVGLLAL